MEVFSAGCLSCFLWLEYAWSFLMDAAPVLFWHRRDLRLSDNVGLARAIARTPKTIGVFCLDPGILQRDDVAPIRVQFMMGCLQELQGRYRAAGSELLVLHAPPLEALPRLAAALNVAAVYWNRDVEPYGRERDRLLHQRLAADGVGVETFWDQLLHAPEEVLTDKKTAYTVYTPYWKNWARQPKAAPHPAPEPASLVGLTDVEREAARGVGAIALPTAADLGFHPPNPLPVEPGEIVAGRQLQAFCHNAIARYGERRNFPGEAGTSRLSAALKFGAIGIRTVWAACVEAADAARSDDTRGNIRTYQQELAWREFYQQAMYRYPELADGPYRKLWQHFPWENNEAYFQAWRAGETGYPIVDAAMRELNETGWMHNRCRMIVASFLTKDLIVNWQWGEKYFMQKLVDGDLSANNGGWQWSASSGMDPKPLRIFNPARQAAKFDPEGEYVRRWLPELRSLDTEHLLTGKISESDRAACGYPPPIVIHRDRQEKFKILYHRLKQGLPKSEERSE